jgi:hypothetical protein
LGLCRVKSWWHWQRESPLPCPNLFFVNLLKPIEISDEYGEGVEDIRQVLMVMGYMKL